MPIILIVEDLSLKYIISNVPYTEIDYKAYMEQIWMIQHGNLKYDEIQGGTGPLVYPAGHVMIYRIMNNITHGMDNIEAGQHTFRYLYILTMMVQFLYFQILGLPPWCTVLSCLSKRLHSIYVLRLFNDCWTTLFMVISVSIFQLASKINKNRWIFCILGSFFYSVAVSVKMNALLYFPGILINLFKLSNGNISKMVPYVFLMIIWQIYVARDFLINYPLEYFHSAFNFQRKFLYEWSINWQVISEDIFQSSIFHKALLICHIIILLHFTLAKFIDKNCLNSIKKALRNPFQDVLVGPIIGDQISFTLLITNFIGVLFSRSLHYQFLSWYQWTLPMLIYWSKLSPWVAILWFVAHEYCWNSYPPNFVASFLLLLLNCFMLIMIYLRYNASYLMGKKNI